LSNVGIIPNADYAPTVPHSHSCLPDDVRGHHTGAHQRRVRGTNKVLFLSSVYGCLDHDRIRPVHTGLGRGRVDEGPRVLDFAGGIVVHATSGFSALAAALYIGKERASCVSRCRPMISHDVLGAAFCGSGGSVSTRQRPVRGIACDHGLVTTHTAAVSATLTWTFAEWVHRGKPTMFGAGPELLQASLRSHRQPVSWADAGALHRMAAGVVCYIALNAKTRFKYDDSLDAFGVHGVGGTLARSWQAYLRRLPLMRPAQTDSSR